MSFRVFLGLGSNLGDRHKYLSSAASSIKTIPGTSVVWTSSVYESDPYGNTGQGRFLNAVLEIQTGLEPDALFHELKRVESVIGRTASERWGPREIDIDILLYDDGVVCHNEVLEVPHHDLPQRRFVLVPFREIAPDVIHPVTGLTIEEMASTCADTTRVVRSIHKIVL